MNHAAAIRHREITDFALSFHAIRQPNVAHLATSEQTIKGLTIPNDTAVQCQFFSVLKDDPIFEESEEFRPERFLNDDGVTFRKVRTLIII